MVSESARAEIGVHRIKLFVNLKSRLASSLLLGVPTGGVSSLVLS